MIKIILCLMSIFCNIIQGYDVRTDPYIGFVQSKNSYNIQTHYFSLSSYAPHEGDIQLVMIDYFYKDHMPHEAFFLKKRPKGAQAKRFCADDLLDWADQNRSLIQAQKKDTFTQHAVFSYATLCMIAPKVRIVGYSPPHREVTDHIMKQIVQNVHEISDRNTLIHMGYALKDTLREFSKQHPLMVIPAGNSKEISHDTHSRFIIGAYDTPFHRCCFHVEKPIQIPFIAPGKDVICRIPGTHQEVQWSGTSVSAAIITGLLALIQGEFGTYFSPDELWYVIKLNAYKNEGDCLVHYGMPDFRSVLYTLHVIYELFKKKEERSRFEQYAQMLYAINHIQVPKTLLVPIKKRIKLYSLRAYIKSSAHFIKMFDKELLSLLNKE